MILVINSSMRSSKTYALIPLFIGFIEFRSIHSIHSFSVSLFHTDSCTHFARYSRLCSHQLIQWLSLVSFSLLMIEDN